MVNGKPMADRQTDDPERQKIIRLVDYLTQLTRLRSKLIRDVAEYERSGKVLWIADIPRERGCFARAWGNDEEHDPDEWLEVQSRREPELPAVPAQCRQWVDQVALRNKDKVPALLTKATRQIPNPEWSAESDQPETITVVEHLEEHPEVRQAWDRYIEDKWLPWTGEHHAWEDVHKAYSELFCIYQEQLRLGEEYELVLGLGLLTWETPSGQRVRRHLIVADAMLEFEARLGRFTVRPHAEGSKLRPEIDMLDIEERPARVEETAKASLVAAEDDPWERGCVERVLQALVHSIDAQGDYVDSLRIKTSGSSTKPVVEYAPALILRKRSTRGLTETLKQIREQLENGGDIPGEFADLAEIRPQSDHVSYDGSEEMKVSFDGEIFFPKSSNDEQRRIVDKMRGASGVLVQGPPGTGKSHTIANLICHLLATGQRTLITAKTPRALQVLEGLVPEELRPLCINLLGSGLDERRSLESSVGGILRKNEDWEEKQAECERTELEKRLGKLREKKAKVERQLRDIRESETHTQSLAGGAYRGTAARIAEDVNRDRSAYGWFTDSVSPDQSCCITADDLCDILTTLRWLTPERRRESSFVWPDTPLSPEQFAELVTEERSAAAEEENAGDGVEEKIADSLKKNDASTVQMVHDTLANFRDMRRKLKVSPHSWVNEAVCDVLNNNASLWHELLRVTRDVVASVGDVVAIADDVKVEFPDTVDLKMLYEDAIRLKEHIASGEKLGWWLFRPKTVKDRRYVIESVKLNGRPCSLVEHFSVLVDALHVRIECGRAWRFWEGRLEKVQGPYVLQLKALETMRNELENVLSLDGLIEDCREAIGQCTEMGEPLWADESQTERVLASCRLALARIRKRHVSEKIRSTDVQVARVAAMSNPHPVTGDLLQAIRRRDVDGFAQSANRISDLEQLRRRLEDVDGRLAVLRQSLPHFVDSLERFCNEPCWEERIRRIDDAWRWAQVKYWVEDYIRSEDAPSLARHARQIEDEINDTIARLAALHAWSFCFSRLEKNHRSHMEAWQQSMRRLGKGTGKHASRHRREAQEHLNQCREAVPAWVMPLHRVWDTVSPMPGMFDVVIVDEASQCGVEGLPLFYLGKRVLIVGDDKQISPDAVGLPRDAVHRLMEEFLRDFHFKSSFDVESSLFDHGKLRYGTRRITLREHFRCMPEIIRFSNDLCYSDTPLIPLRQYGPNRLPPLEHVFVREGYREGSGNRACNRPEAEAVVKRIAAMCEDNRYDGKTMGVVVLQGEAQAELIESRLLECLGAEEMERRRLVCGNPYSFQGDERDVMLLSLVAAGNERIGPLTKATDERRFNVGASRARDQMILFHSVTCEDLSASCLRRRLLDFFENMRPQQIAGIERNELERRAAQDNRRVVSPPAPFESWFEVDVALELLRKGFVVLAQHEIAGKRIDLVVEGGRARLAIECDGDHWHGAERYEADMQRQRQLERCGWEFFRVRESAFYANKKDALAGLWHVLEERGILPDSMIQTLECGDGEEFVVTKPNGIRIA